MKESAAPCISQGACCAYPARAGGVQCVVCALQGHPVDQALVVDGCVTHAFHLRTQQQHRWCGGGAGLVEPEMSVWGGGGGEE